MIFIKRLRLRFVFPLLLLVLGPVRLSPTHLPNRWVPPGSALGLAEPAPPISGSLPLSSTDSEETDKKEIDPQTEKTEKKVEQIHDSEMLKDLDLLLNLEMIQVMDALGDGVGSGSKKKPKPHREAP